MLPDVSIIIPTRNEARYIEGCLNAVLNQDYPGQMEILIADGMSTDDTREIVQRLTIKRSNIQFINNHQKIVPTALNLALRHARGDIIIRVDGHCEISPDYISTCVEHLQGNDIAGVGGPIETIGEDHLSQIIALAMSSHFGVGGSAFRTVKDRAMLTDSVPFPAYTREIIVKAGLFDEELVRNQDDEYNYRIRKMGGKILLTPDIHSRYYSRASFSELWSQYYQYGFWKVRVLQKHPGQMHIRQFVPPAFVIGLIISTFLSFILLFGRYLLAIVLGSYLLANLSASLWTASRKGWRYFHMLPLAYAIMHVGYGLGFLVGLVRFISRWSDKDGKVPSLEENKIQPESDG